MKHLDDGTLLALVDEDTSDVQRADAMRHLETCEECSLRSALLAEERRLVSAALAELDVEPPLASARRALSARARAGASASRPWWRTGLAKAAGLVLAFAAAGSAAIPGSPVRSWLGLETGAEVATEDNPSATAPTVEAPAPEEVGVRLAAAADGSLTVSITGLVPGAQVRVLLVDEEASGVFAAEGARFQTSAGRVEAVVPGSYVRIELSRTLAVAAVEVDGALYLRKTGERLELAGPLPDTADAEISFRVPGRRP